MSAAIQGPVRAVAWASHAKTTIRGADGRVLTECGGHGGHSTEDEAVARHIQTCINAHAKLVQFVEEWANAGNGEAARLLHNLGKP